MSYKEKRILCTGCSGFIGTHLADSFIEQNVDFLNIDIKAPNKRAHRKYWINCDILDFKKLNSIFYDYRPDYVIHLAARTDMQGNTLDDYQENSDGTLNVLESIKLTPRASRVIITSTQHVRKPGSGFPKDDEDFDPYMTYGQSKVLTEKITRNAGLNCVWTIIRPTTIWGAWHPKFGDGLWRIMKKGYYFHPSGKPIIRSYGYVGNVVWQIERILQAPENLINHRVFYVGDPCIRQIDWLDAFSRTLTGKAVRIVPRVLIRTLAYGGDILEKFGYGFPMNTPRFRNLTTDNPVPISPTIEALGDPPFSLDEGINVTVNWLKNQSHLWDN